MKPSTLAMAVALLSCSSETGTEFRLMDAPPPDVTAVKLHVASIQAHVDPDKSKDKGDPADSSIDDDNKWVSLAVDRQIDLVKAQGEAAADVLGQLNLPEGKITQIRLVLDTTKPNTATWKGQDCNLDVEEVAKKGIKINHVFKAFEASSGSKQEIYVDFDLEKSLHQKGSCFELKPHLKLHKVKVDGKEQAL